MKKNNSEMPIIEKAIRKLVESQKKTEEMQKKTEEMQKKTDEEINKLLKNQDNTNKQIAKLTDSWGQFVEGIVEPSIPKLFEEYGIRIAGTHQRAKRHKNGEELEIDILAVSEKEKNIIVAVEAKSTLRISDVNSFVLDMKSFFDFFDEYRGRQLIGVMCGIRLVKGVTKYAEKKGFYILGPSGENVVPLNKISFRPKKWTS